MSKECDHEYKEVVSKSVIPVVRRFNYRDNLIGTVEQSTVSIFCIKCGDSKIIVQNTEEDDHDT